MVEKDILKKIVFLKDLSDPILEKIGRLARIESFKGKSILYRQNQEKPDLYMLVSGKVFLNCETFSGKSLTLDEVMPGRTFGSGVLMGESSSTFTAVCAEPCEIIRLSGEQMQLLFKEDFEAGHILMMKVVELFKSRMEMHTRQFLQLLTTHPEVRALG